jgi:glycosyltransferase 2 family protein
LKKSTGRYLKIILSLSLGLALLWYITRRQDIGLIILEFRQANYFWIFLSVCAMLLSHFFRALRWNLLIGALNYHTSTRQTFGALMSGYLSNTAVPRLGEITRCLMLSKSGHMPFNSLIGTVVSERVFDLVSLLIIIALTILFQISFLGAFLKKNLLDPLMSTGLGVTVNWIIAALVFLFFTTLVFLAWRALYVKTHAENSPLYRLKRQLTGLSHGVKTIWHMNHKIRFIAYTVVIWTLYFMSIYLCFLAIYATSHLGPMAALTLLAVGSLGIVAPVPGGIGTYHFLVILSLTELYGIASEPATSFAYISHASQTLLILLVGGISWISISLTTKAKNKRKKQL